MDLLEQKHYLAGITIIEGRNFQGKDSSGTSDPFIIVKCAGQTQQTQKKYKVNSATWNQTLTFPGIMMNQFELEAFELIIECYDHNPILANELIGKYSIGLSTLHRSLNHEFYRTWVGLFDEDNPNKVQGYLLISCYIVGPNEQPPVHIDDGEMGEEEYADSDEDENDVAERIENIKRAQGVTQLFDPVKINKSYQLSVIIALAQGLPVVDSSSRIKPFVSCRAFGCMLTTPVSQNPDPKFNSRLQFPIYYPVLNDKITMRIWSQKGGLSSNVFIANIPEHPGPSDYFNLSKLLQSDGRMSARWVNLYGTHPMERSERTKGRREGSAYLGRILLSLTLTSNDFPTLGPAVSNPVNEPKMKQYQVWVDIYRLIKCDVIPEGSSIWAQVSIGNYKSDEKIPVKYNKEKKMYKWTKICLPPLQNLQLPKDLAQIPDIFINLFVSTFSTKERFAYLRVSPNNHLQQKPHPSWFRLKSPYNDTGNTSVGLLMCNIQLMRYDPASEEPPKRQAKQAEGKQLYKFYYQILSGFELASAIKEQNLNTRVELTIGKQGQETGIFRTPFLEGRYPVWNHFDSKDVMLEKELLFESDMRVTVQNQKAGVFGAVSNQIIGEFAVPVQSMMKQSEKPQFFHVLNSQGQLMGSLLCNFYLKIFERDPKTKKIKGYVDPVHVKIIEEFKEVMTPLHTVDISFSMLGIRNLVKKAIQPVVVLRLTSVPDSEERIELEHERAESTHNPSFGKRIVFEKVSLPTEPLCWPYIEVLVRDEGKGGNLLASKGCEECYTTISLIDFAHGLLSDQDIRYAQAQLARNQDRLEVIQPQISTIDFLKGIGAFMDKNLFEEESEQTSENEENPSPEQKGQKRSTVVRASLGRFTKNLQNLGTIDLFKVIALPDPEDVENMVRAGSETRAQESLDGLDSDEDNMQDWLNKAPSEDGQHAELKKGVIIDPIQEFYVFPNDKIKEERDRRQKLQDIEETRRIYQRKLQELSPEDKASQDVLKNQIIVLNEEVEGLQEEKMTEQRFWGLAALEEGASTFDYGRDIIKEGTYETVLRLPYKQFPLFTEADWFPDSAARPLVQVSGILRSGNISGAFIKGQLKIALSEEEDDSEDEEDEEDEAEDQAGEKVFSDIRAERNLQICQRISRIFPFDISRPECLDRLTEDRSLYAIRVYLLSAQNLTATGTVIDFKSRMAGMTALSTANPYPQITVGDGISLDEVKTKRVVDRDRAIQGDLNPQFFRMYELFGSFPEDWKLELAIYDKGSVAAMDQLIGSTVVDIENRLFGNLLWINRHTLMIEQSKIKAQLSALKRDKSKGTKATEVALKRRKDELNRWKTRIKEVEQIYVPIEYRELLHPMKTQAQGMAEMWVEVITWEESKKIIPQKMQTIDYESYEIRLIVWETRDVPLIDGDSVDIYVRVIWDPTGWSEDEVEKSTDIHHNSATGWGQFNWRFKFDMDLPLDFPRIKFIIHDSGVFSDEAVGQATLNLKRTLQKLRKEGFVEIPKTYIACQHPNKPGEERGLLMFSMQILAKEEANNVPVGEAQEEPNIDPVLQKPTAGRGLGEVLKASRWSIDMSWNPFGKFLPFITAAFVLVCLALFAMYYKMFTG